MEVHPPFPARTVAEFITYAKANPGKINFASAGNGSVAHVSAELFKMMADVNMVHVAYRGAPAALTDLFGGHVHVMFDNLPSSLEYIKTGSLRALGVSSPTRLDLLPDVPAVAETVPGFETAAFAGIGAPRDTSASVIDKLNAEVNAGLADPALKARISELGGTPMPLSPVEFANLIGEETQKWGRVIRTANISME
jgi:tripartite-type tricarboxylate transporter receptor subunit TctC